MKLFYRGKHSGKRWWEFWKKAHTGEKLIKHTEVPIDISEEVEAFKAEQEEQEKNFTVSLMEKLKELDIHEFLQDCYHFLSPMPYKEFYELVNDALSEANETRTPGRYFLVCLFKKNIWNEVKQDEISTMAGLV